MKKHIQLSIITVGFWLVINSLNAQNAIVYQQQIDGTTRVLDKSSCVPGSLPGSVDVSPTGAASYSIPIAMSPGSNGVVPNLSVVYNSRSGNGILGWGFNLAGLSAISRTNRTVYYDGRNENYCLADSDAFELGGQRLFKSAANTYYLENDPYTKVVYSTTTKSFTVYTPNGGTIEYGNSTNSKLIALGASIPISYMINKSIDANGNYIEYIYTGSSLTGEYNISEIKYTGNQLNGMSPYDSVKFNYGTRSDCNTAYVPGGNQIKQTQLLKTIQVFAEGTLSKQYDFGYFLGVDGISKLNTISFVGDGVRYNSTVVNWRSNDGIETTSTFQQTLKSKLYFADLNGNGVKEKILWDQNKLLTIKFDGDWRDFYIALQQDLMIPSNTVDSCIFNVDDIGFSDINNDGNEEIIVAYTKTEFQKKGSPLPLKSSSVYESTDGQTSYTINTIVSSYVTSIAYNGSTFSSNCIYDEFVFMDSYNSYTGQPKALNTSLAIYDPDCNGIEDLFILYNGMIQFIKSDIITNINEISIIDVRVVDFNGNGTDELLIVLSDGSIKIYEYCNKKFIKIYERQKFCANPIDFLTGDINGDGKTDFLNFNSDILSFKNQGLWLSTGSDINNIFSSLGALKPSLNGEWETWDINRAKGAYYSIFDTNGDGKDEIIRATDGLIEILSLTYNYNYSLIAKLLNLPKNPNISQNFIDYLNFIDINDDGVNDIVYKSKKEDISIIYKKDITSLNLLITSITNGMNLTSTLKFTSLKETRTFNSSFQKPLLPLVLVRNSMFLLSNLKTIDDKKTMVSDINYVFEEGIQHINIGFLGFKKYLASNSVTGTSVSKNYTFYITGAYYYPWLQSQKVSRNAIPIYEATNIMVAKRVSSNGKSFVPITTSSTQIDKLKNVTTSTSTTFDETIGKVTSQTTTTGSWTQTQTSLFEKAGTGEFTYRLAKATSTKNNGIDNYTETQNFTYSSGNTPFRVLSITSQNTNVTTFNSFDVWGNVTTLTNTTPTASSRTTSYTYDSKGRFRLSERNALGYTASKTCRITDGLTLTSTDINGLKTTNSLTIAGNKISNSVLAPDGNSTTTSTEWDSSNSYLYFTKMVDILTGNSSYTYFNALGQKAKTIEIGYKGAPTTTSYQYNTDGSLASTAVSGITTPTTNKYMSDGRLLSISSAQGMVTYTYSNLKVTEQTTMGSSSKIKVSIFDEAGLLKSVSSDNGVVSYSYFASGRVKDVTAAGGVSRMEYDNLGNQKSLESPDSGKMLYTYDGFGQLLTQTDAKGQKTTCKYDILGRLTSKIGTHASGTVGFSESYIYFETAGKFGLISKITRDGVTESYDYDSYGRPISTTTSGAGKSFTTSYGYYSNGNLSTLTSPTGLKITYQYDVARNITQILNASNNSKIWSGDSQNAQSQWSVFSLGNGLVTQFGYNASNYTLSTIKTGSVSNPTFIQYLAYSINNQGDLLQRIDNTAPASPLSEIFTYDNQNRLTTAKLGSGELQSYKYALNGNIDSTSFSGKYGYSLSGFPHAVTNVSGVTSNTLSPKMAINTAYSLDNKILNIENGVIQANGIMVSENKAIFTYGVDGNRFKMDWYKAGTLKQSKIYVGNNEFGYDAAGTLIYSRTFINAPTGICAVYQDSASLKTINYIHTDNQGSWLAITNSSGVITNRYSYDAWGRARDPKTWKLKPIDPAKALVDMSIMQPRFDRGYKGHEQLAGFALINMNGRLYDPYLQRFLSPDNVVQAPDNAQNYNRYSYCLNNPLKYTDPSGWVLLSMYDANSEREKNGEERVAGLNSSSSYDGMTTFRNGVPGSQGFTSCGDGTFIDNATATVVNFGYYYGFTKTTLNLESIFEIRVNKGRLGYWVTSTSADNSSNAINGINKSNTLSTTIVTNIFVEFGGGQGQGGRFPLDERVNSYLEYPGRFGDSRDEGSRKHGGADLYAPVATNVYAVKDGTVIQNPYKFYRGSYAIEVNHGNFIARYSEINVAIGLRAGSILTQGQLIGTVADLSLNKSMLHFEMYSGSA